MKLPCRYNASCPRNYVVLPGKPPYCNEHRKVLKIIERRAALRPPRAPKPEPVLLAEDMADLEDTTSLFERVAFVDWMIRESVVDAPHGEVFV